MHEDIKEELNMEEELINLVGFNKEKNIFRLGETLSRDRVTLRRMTIYILDK
jgi:hypothetical protein